MDSPFDAGNPYTLYLPTHVPGRRENPRIPLADVRAPGDLPPYLFMGPLDESSCAFGPAGWSATWRRDRDTWFQLDFDTTSGGITARDAWRGLEGYISRLDKPDLKRLAYMRFVRPVRSWEEKAEEVLEARWNLKYVKAEDDGLIMGGLPDGLMKTLLLPVAVDALPQLVETSAGLRNEAGMDFPVAGYVVPLMGAVNYIEGRNPPWTEEPGELLMRSFFSTGFPPTGMPVREEAKGGSAAWTVRRIVCMAFIAVPFVGLIPLLERLERDGLIADGPMRSNDEQPGIDSVEFSGCVVPAGIEIQAEYIAWMSSDQKRRVSWLMPQDHMKTLHAHATHRGDDPDLARRGAAEVVAKSRAWLREAFETCEQTK